jgi:hypothetical protein
MVAALLPDIVELTIASRAGDQVATPPPPPTVYWPISALQVALLPEIVEPVIEDAGGTPRGIEAM